MYIEKRGVNYEEYVARQGRKASNPKKREMFKKHSPQRTRGFTMIFKKVKADLNSGAILCLGARTGCEVVAAIRVGFNGSKGIDLHPIGSNVVRGDWHNIPFPSNSFENVYSNSLDHCYDVESLAREIKRVLKAGGLFFFQLSKKQTLASKKDKELYMSQSANFLFWDKGRDLADGFAEHGFILVKEWTNHKWENFIMRIEK